MLPIRGVTTETGGSALEKGHLVPSSGKKKWGQSNECIGERTQRRKELRVRLAMLQIERSLIS